MHPLIHTFLHTDDLETQQVLADQLCEQGHPRGEFIAVQLARGSAPLTDHERTLIQAHLHEWIGPIAAIDHAPARRWRRGFLSEVLLRLPSAEKTLAAIPTPWWQTVEVIRIHKVGSLRDPFTRLLLEAPLHALTTFEGPLPIDAFTGWLQGSPRPLTSASLPRLPTFPNTAAIDALTPALSASGLPLLRHARLRTYIGDAPDDYAWLWSTALGQQLSSLTLAASPLLAGPWWLQLRSEAPRLQQLALESTGCRIEFTHDTLHFEFTSPRFYGLAPTSFTQEELVLRILSSLPEDSLSRVSGSQSERIDEELQRVCKR